MYKLSYNIAMLTDEKIVKYSNNEIELAEDILDMERDVGKICFNVKIEKIKRLKEMEHRDRKASLQRIERFAKILIKDCK